MNASSGSAGRRVMLLGGSSEIGLACVRELQSHAPREVALVGRDRERLRGAAAGLRDVGVARVIESELDALDLERHQEVLGQAIEQLGGVDIVILAVGALGERGGMPGEISTAVELLHLNAVCAGSLLMHAAQGLREGGGGSLVVLSSVAAERPRRANAVYGASKAALDSLAQSLGGELREEGVQVLVVRPGFVHGRMTGGLKPAPLATTPAVVALVVREGLERGRHTVWAPRALQAAMLILRMLPRGLFQRIRQ